MSKLETNQVLKWIVCLITLLLFLFHFPGTINAQTYFFNEEFNVTRPINTLDNNIWEYFNSAPASVPTIQEAGGNLVLTQLPNTFRFPYIVSKQPALPNGDFSTEIKFQYTKVTPWGSGFALSDSKPVYGVNTLSSLLNISVWQDQTLGPNMRIHFNSSIVHTIPLNTDAHIFRVDHLGTKYYLYLDSQLVYTSPETPIETKYIWLGHYGVQSLSVPNWTTFNIDYIRVTNSPSSPTPTPTPQPTPSLSPITPLIFIPGIGGSELRVNIQTLWVAPDGHGGNYINNYTFGEKVWVNNAEVIRPGNDDYFDILRMKPDGIIPEALLGLTGNFAGAYQDTMNFFNNNGYTLGSNFFMFGYDWRRDVTHTSPYLDQLINQIRTQTGSQKVDIVAHSMGGLVARNYIQDTANASKIRKLIEIGVPHLGSVDALQSLHYGRCLYRQIGSVCLTLNQNELKDLFQNMISGFQLIPSEKYYTFYDGLDLEHPTPFYDGADIDDNHVTGSLGYNSTKNLLTNLGHNTSLFNPAESLHQVITNFADTNEIDTTIIVGSGIPTLGQIIEKQITGLFGQKIAKKDHILINGDGTVPLFSASLSDLERNNSISGSAKVYYSNQNHSDLITNGPALSLVKSLLISDPSLPSGITATPGKFAGKQISVHSPITLDLYDQYGNHTGINELGHVEETIPGSIYSSIDDAKFIWIPSDGVYDLKMKATDNGSFDLKIRDYQNDTNTETIIYRDIPIELNTEAEATFDTTNISPPTLYIDQNGDGLVDREIPPTAVLTGSDLADNTPPEARISMAIDKGEIIIEGADQTPTTVTKSENTNTDNANDAFYILNDVSGNSLKLDIRAQNVGNNVSYTIYSLQYNSDPLVVLSLNQFKLLYSGIKNPMNITEQIYESKEGLKTRIQFNKQKNQSNIFTEDGVKETKSGLTILQLQTDKGKIKTIY